MTVLIRDEKRLVSVTQNYFWQMQNAAGYHPGPVMPPSTEVNTK